MNAKGNISRVEPIRDMKKLGEMKDYLKETNPRDYLMFVLGINTGLRISDLLKLTVEGTKDGKVSVRETKTKKVREFSLSGTCMKTIKWYLQETGITHGTLFPSTENKEHAISTRQAWHVLKKAADYVGITENVGTHTMRKTFGWYHYRNGVSIGYLQSCFNHSSPAVTMRYIGITQDELNDKVYLKSDL